MVFMENWIKYKKCVVSVHIKHEKGYETKKTLFMILYFVIDINKSNKPDEGRPPSDP